MADEPNPAHMSAALLAQRFTQDIALALAKFREDQPEGMTEMDVVEAVLTSRLCMTLEGLTELFTRLLAGQLEVNASLERQVAAQRSRISDLEREREAYREVAIEKEQELLRRTDGQH